MVAVWFVRHGESESNAGLPTVNSATIKLTARGHEQAEQVARSLPLPDLIITSPYLRTKQTADPTIDRFPDSPQAEWAVQEFTYLARSSGRTTRHDRRPQVDAYWERCDPFYVDGEGAESFADLMQRVEVLRDQLHQRDQHDEQFIVIFSHAMFIRAFLWSQLADPIQVSPEGMQRFRSFVRALRVPNGSIIKAHFQNSEVFLSGVLTAHLSPPLVNTPSALPDSLSEP